MIVGVLANGDLTVTPYLNIVVGNVRQKKISEYWREGLNNAYANKEILNSLIKCRTLTDLYNQDDDTRYINL